MPVRLILYLMRDDVMSHCKMAAVTLAMGSRVRHGFLILMVMVMTINTMVVVMGDMMLVADNHGSTAIPLHHPVLDFLLWVLVEGARCLRRIVGDYLIFRKVHINRDVRRGSVVCCESLRLAR